MGTWLRKWVGPKKKTISCVLRHNSSCGVHVSRQSLTAKHCVLSIATRRARTDHFEVVRESSTDAAGVRTVGKLNFKRNCVRDPAHIPQYAHTRFRTYVTKHGVDFVCSKGVRVGNVQVRVNINA